VLKKAALPLLVVGLVAAGSFLVGLHSAPAGPNLLLVTLDTTRSDHCSLYGYPLRTTPNLERLAGEGVTVEEAYAPMPSTEPSHATMFTSAYPISHGVLKNGFVLTDDHVTLAEVLKARGYQTAACVSSFALNRKFGFAQGFDLYDDEFKDRRSSMKRAHWMGHEVTGEFDRRADATTRRALDWLRSSLRRDRPFFLWVHYFDPHAPYDPPEPYRSRFRPSGTSPLDEAIAHYDGEVAFTDAELGRLVDALDAMGLKESTLVVVVGDHGEGLMEHQRMEHGLLVYEEAVRVPLLFRWPGVLPAARRVAGPVEMVDLMPTLLAMLGLRGGTALDPQGREIGALLTGQAGSDPERACFLQRRLYDAGALEDGIAVKGLKFGVRAGRWKYIVAPEEGTQELYDLAEDPDEARNVLASHEAEAAKLAADLAAWERRFARENASQEISEEDRERLRALGYVH
jgi:choline-sulfatase